MGCGIGYLDDEFVLSAETEPCPDMVTQVDSRGPVYQVEFDSILDEMTMINNGSDEKN